jgi:hypothetical protein
MADVVWYVYGVVPADLALDGAPRGLDGASVALERDGGLGALVSTLPADSYGSDPLAGHSGDLDWVGPRAVAHDAVVTWASDRAAVAPFPMFTMFRDASGVHGMLAARRDELEASLARARSGREYALRVWRLDDELRAHLAEVSPRVAELEAQARDASPGQRYLLERKLDELRRSELREAGRSMAAEAFDALRAVSLDGVADPLPAAQEGKGAAVLSAAFLVAPDTLTRFRETLTAIAARGESLGFRFEFTGPWPPYHFVGGRGDGR